MKGEEKRDYSLESGFVRRLDADILDFIRQGLDYQDEARFNDIARREFELQFNANQPYREYCLRKGLTPESISCWEEIPAIPSEAFKENILTSFPVEKTELAYMTGGTTTRRRARIYRDRRAMELIFEANRLVTKSFLFPDVERMKILLMVPSPQLAPTMGMAVGLEQVRLSFGTSESAYLITRKGLEVKVLLSSLEKAEKTGKPLALIGATSGFIYFFNVCEQEGLKFQLPEGSRICDGGGYTGRFGECSREDYYEKCWKVLGIPKDFCVNTYGTGETSTNYFDNVLRNNFLGIERERCKLDLPWTRTIVVDTRTFKQLPKGQVGLLRHCDLVNRAMVLAVQTDNLGRETDVGFEICGRAGVKEGVIGTTPVDRMVGQMSGRRGRLVDSLLNFLVRWQVPRKARSYSARRSAGRKGGENAKT